MNTSPHTSRPKGEKCIVFGCVNHHGEGGFVGTMCTPCHEMITTGKIGPTTSFIGDMFDTIQQANRRMLAVSSITASMNRQVELRSKTQ